MASGDPFLSAQADILALLAQSRPSLASYLRIRSSASSASSPELIEARQELEGTLTDLSNDLQDLVDSVRAVEGDPYRYGLEIDEVARRRKLVEDVGKEVASMRQQLSQTVHAADLAHPDSFGTPGEDEDDYSAWEEQRQMEIMHEQDEALDGVFQTVGNLRQQADTMGRELEEQAELLDEFDGITDRVGGKLGSGLQKMRYVIEKNEGKFIHGLSMFWPDWLRLVFSSLTRSESIDRWSVTMHDNRKSVHFNTMLPTNIVKDSHPLLAQTPLSVNPFIDLPKPPTLPHNYASLPSTLPPSSIDVAPAGPNSELPAYVTSRSGDFAAHPSTIIAQNKALLSQLEREAKEAEEKIRSWEQGIKDRELAEKRRKAPGWLDGEQKILEPERARRENKSADIKLMDDPASNETESKTKKVDELGDAMDRVFGRSEMG
nr:t-snare affecting a late golgi compartment protein 1 [Quercus suber]